MNTQRIDRTILVEFVQLDLLGQLDVLFYALRLWGRKQVRKAAQYIGFRK